MIRIPYCLSCTNCRQGMCCVAYPDGIPDEVLHTEKKDGETCKNNISFSKKNVPPADNG